MNKLNEIDLSYLSGVWDGDGTFVLSKKKDGAVLKFTAHFQVTSKLLFEKVKSLLEGLPINCVKIDAIESKGNRKKVYRLRVDNLQDNQKFLESILPYLTGKKEVAETALRFVKHRQQAKSTLITRRDDRGRIIHVKNISVYNAEDAEAYQSMKRLNGTGASRIDKENLFVPISATPVTDVDIAYLAGLLDAEGNFSITKRRGRYGSEFNYEAVCHITNCDTSIINAVLRIFHNLKVERYCLAKIGKKSSNQSLAYRIIVTHLETLNSFLTVIIPFLRGKQYLAIMMQEFAVSRLEARMNAGSSCKASYSESEIAIYDQMKVLNARGKNSISKRAVTERSVTCKPCELLETPNSEMGRTISSTHTQVNHKNLDVCCSTTTSVELSGSKRRASHLCEMEI